MNPKKFYKDISGMAGNSYLKSIWDGLGNRLGETRSSNGLKVFKREINKANEVYIISLPYPKETTEALYVAALFSLQKLVFSIDINSVRFLTLELGQNNINGLPEYHFCEWIGNPLSGREHKNYGLLLDNNIDTFIYTIEDLV
jgi:hypothetical protein